MKLQFTLLGLCGLTLAAVVAGVVVTRSRTAALTTHTAQQLFQVKGQVRSLEADGTVRIAHEDIPGFMPAMEMPFTVKDPALLRGLAPGDAVQFQLVVTKDDSWIGRMEKIPATSLNPAARLSSSPLTNADSAVPQPDQLQVGQEVPDFSLVDQQGNAFHLRDFRGKAVVLTFIYTRCPLPNFCPLMSKNFSSLQERFNKQCPGKVELLSISFDPQFDTPETLSRYAGLYQAEARPGCDWRFATGTTEQINLLTGCFGLVREPEGGFIRHDLRTALISPQGKLVHVWRSNVWTPYEVQRMVQETLQLNLAASR